MSVDEWPLKVVKATVGGSMAEIETSWSIHADSPRTLIDKWWWKSGEHEQVKVKMIGELLWWQKDATIYTKEEWSAHMQHVV